MLRLSIIIMLMMLIPFSEAAYAQSRRRSAPSSRNVTDIRKVDFKNFTHNLDGKLVPLRNGSYQDNKREFYGAYLPEVIYGDLDGDGLDEAAFVIIYGKYEGWRKDKVFVYTIKNNELRLLSSFEVTKNECGQESSLRIQSGILINQGNDCSIVEIRKYRWNGKSFMQIGNTETRPFN